MKEVIAYNPPVSFIREQILAVGDKIGSVWFNKRSDNSLRKLCYKLHCKHPSAAKAPKGVSNGSNTSQSNGSSDFRFKRRDIDKANDQITVLSTNDTVRDKEGKVIGRGAWKTIPLNLVTRIVSNGTIYTINRNY